MGVWVFSVALVLVGGLAVLATINAERRHAADEADRISRKAFKHDWRAGKP